MPTLFFVQIFRRIRPRRQPNQLTPIAQVLIKLRGMKQVNASNEKTPVSVAAKTKKKTPLMLPWWWLIIAYIISFLCVVMAAFFTIARGIEFGDVKTQKWLVSVLASFLSAVFFSQPIKVICLTIFVTCLKRKSEHDDNEMALYLDENEATYLNNDEEYLHSMHHPMAAIRKRTLCNRLTEGQVAHARNIRLRDKRIWQAVREMLGFVFLAFTIYTLSYLERDHNAIYQVKHLRHLFLNIGKPNHDFTQVCLLSSSSTVHLCHIR
jgi:hypothetical protein